MTKTLKLKVKPSSYPFLNRAATEVNIAWNQANEIYNQHIKEQKYLSHFDLNYLTMGWAKAHFKDSLQMTISRLNKEIVIRSKQEKKKLRARVSFGGKKALGWIPFTANCLRKNGEKGLKFNKHSIKVFESSKLSEFKSHKDWKDSCFAQDAVGDWYLCLSVDQKCDWDDAEKHAVGIDLGQRTAATTSDGDKFESGFYERKRKELKQLQRKKTRVLSKLSKRKKRAKTDEDKMKAEIKLKQYKELKAKRKKKSQIDLTIAKLHRKIARQRNDAMHKFTTGLIKKYENIFIGDVSFKFLSSGKGRAKKSYDNATSRLKYMLSYKGQQAGRFVGVVNEAFTTQACSSCGSICGPKGQAGLGESDWQCADCETVHDRDVNAAINICHSGMEQHPPFAGTGRTILSPSSCCETWISDKIVTA